MENPYAAPTSIEAPPLDDERALDIARATGPWVRVGAVGLGLTSLLFVAFGAFIISFAKHTADGGFKERMDVIGAVFFFSTGVTGLGLSVLLWRIASVARLNLVEYLRRTRTFWKATLLTTALLTVLMVGLSVWAAPPTPP